MASRQSHPLTERSRIVEGLFICCSWLSHCRCATAALTVATPPPLPRVWRFEFHRVKSCLMRRLSRRSIWPPQQRQICGALWRRRRPTKHALSSSLAVIAHRAPFTGQRRTQLLTQSVSEKKILKKEIKTNIIKTQTLTVKFKRQYLHRYTNYYYMILRCVMVHINHPLSPSLSLALPDQQGHV